MNDTAIPPLPHDAETVEVLDAAPIGTAAPAGASPVPAHGQDAAALGMKPFEEWAQAKGTDYALLAAARAVGHWAQGKELTEADFDAGVAEAANATMGG